MDIWKRITRKPVSTAVWLVLLMLASLLIGTAASVYYSARGVPEAIDRRGITIAVHQPKSERNLDGSFTLNPGDVLLFEEDFDYLRSLPMVREVDFRYFSGAYIEGLTVKLGLGDFFGQTQDIGGQIGGYPNESARGVILIGTVEAAFTDPYDSLERYDLSAIGGPERVGETTQAAVIRVEEAVVMHPDYPLFKRYDGDEWYNGRVSVILQVFGDGTEPFFEVGKRYAIQGSYDPLPHKPGRADEMPYLPSVELNASIGIFSGFCEDGALYQYRDVEYEIEDTSAPSPDGFMTTRLLSRDRRVPAAAEWNGAAEELLMDESWSGIAREYEMALNSFPVLGTNDLESMYSFMNGEAAIVRGRSFTKEEYDTGAKVLILDEGVAASAGVSVGDTLKIKQFRAATDISEGNHSMNTDIKDAVWSDFNNPTLGGNVFYHGLPEGEAEEFTVVGLYRMENEWKNRIGSFTPNTVFMPQKAQTAEAYGGPARQTGTETFTFTGQDGEEITFDEPVYETGLTNGVFMSVVLKNGFIEDFLARIDADSEYKEYPDENKPDGVWRSYIKGLGAHKFLCFDQGFGAQKDSLYASVAAAERLAVLMAAGAALIFAVYMLIHQSAERKTLGIMRSLGAEPRAAGRYLFLSGLIVVAAGFVLGSLFSGAFAGVLTDRLAGAAVIEDAALFREMLGESAAPWWVYAVLALAEIGLAALALYVHAAAVSRKNPRKLLGK